MMKIMSTSFLPDDSVFHVKSGGTDRTVQILTDRVQWAVGITEVQMRQRVSSGQEPEEKLQHKFTISIL